MSFVSHTEEDRSRMLGAIGVKSVEDLFTDIPENLRLKDDLALPAALSEREADLLLKEAAASNGLSASFLGAGAYRHYIPAAVDQLTIRSEFYTAYTPYQPEVSQGTLTAIFEFQTMLCRLTGMEVSNASMYDGATSLAEAVLMSVRSNNRGRVLMSESVNPHYRDVLKTYAWANGLNLKEFPSEGGCCRAEALECELDADTSAVVVQSPNFFGCIEDLQKIAGVVHSGKAYLIVVVNEPLSLAMIKSPGELGADIVCGEAGSLGNPVGFGGPMLGMLAARGEFVRRMPGRLVGKTTDADGREAYVLTLQTREQHIRRERATSNICTNQGLCALRSVIYLSLLGSGLSDLARLNHRMAVHLRDRLLAKGFRRVHEGAFFNEFTLRYKGSRALAEDLRKKGFLLGVDLGAHYRDYEDCLLICTTEMNSPEEINALIEAL